MLTDNLKDYTLEELKSAYQCELILRDFLYSGGLRQVMHFTYPIEINLLIPFLWQSQVSCVFDMLPSMTAISD